MAAANQGAYIGDRNFMPSTTDYAAIATKDPAFYNAGLAKLQHAATVALPLEVDATVNAATVTGLAYTFPFPVQVIDVQFGCESAAGSAATAILERAESTANTSWSSMMESATDIKTAAGYYQTGSITSTKTTFDAGDRVRLSVTGTGAGAVVGTKAIVTYIRL